MNKPPLVTVAITTHERADFLRVCLQSVCTQTYTNLEIYIFDNSTTDAVKNCVAEMADSRITCLQNPPNISDNIVINHQRAFKPRAGLYHIVLSSDWSMKPNAIELMVAALTSDPSICAVTSDECQFDLDTGERRSRPLSYPGYASGEVPGSHEQLDSRRMIHDAFFTLTGIGIAYHTLIVSEVLASANLVRMFLSQSHEHQLGLELLLQKSAFGMIRQELFEEMVHHAHFELGSFRRYSRFTEAVARQQFLEKNYLELLSRGFKVTTLQLGLAGLFAKCMFRWEERPFDSAGRFARLTFPMLAAALFAPLYLLPALLRAAIRKL